MGGARRETRYGYDADGRRNYVLSPNGLETRTAFDAAGREIETKTRAGGRDYVTRKGYDRFGRLVWSQDPQQASVSPALYTTYLYVTDHDNSTNWTAADDCSGVTDPRYGQLAIVFHEDNDNNPLNNDNYISAASAKMFEMYGYDSQGRQTDVVKPASLGDSIGYATTVCTKTIYDNKGRVDSVIMNYRADLTSDSQTNLKFVFHYDLHGNRSEVVYPSGLVKQWQYKYNGDDQLTSMTETQVGYAAAPPAWKRNTYDPVTGLSSALTDAVGNVIISQYDSNNRLSRTLHTPASTPSQPAWNVNYSYDDSGRISEVKSFAGSGASQQIYGETREYDNETGGISKVSKSADGTGIGTLNYTYNNQGALASMSWLGRSVSYDYDEFGRIKTARANEADWEYTYAPCGKKSTVHNTRQNEIEKIEYDGLGRILSISHENVATGEPIFQITYRLGPDGNRVGAYERRKTADDDIATSWSYTYDALSRLIRERRSIKNSPQGEYAPDHDVSYEYDREHDSSRTKLIDNFRHVTETYHYIPGSQRLGRITRSDDTSTSYTWTANGEMAREENYQSTTLLSTKYYSWGIGGTLSEVRIEDAEDNVTVVSYEYDHENELIGRKVTFKENLIESERYLVDHKNPTGYSQRLAVFDTITGAIRHEIVTDELAAETTVQSGSANTQYPHADALGSIRALTGKSASGQTLGASAERHFYDYTAFGTSLRGDRSLTCYSFASENTDPLSGLQYNRSRRYNSTIGQFISIDPLFDFPENYGSSHIYVGQNPISYIDPSGKSFDLKSTLITVGGMAEMAVIRWGQYALPIGDVLIGLVVDDPTISLTPMGSSVSATKREVIEQVMHKNILSRGYELVAMQFRSNGPGFDGVYHKMGTALDNARNFFRAEFKVTGTSRSAEELLGSTQYGVQTSKSWDLRGYERLKEVPQEIRNLRWEEAANLRKPGNWTNLPDATIDLLRRNADDVQKRLIGASVIDDATERGGALTVNIKEYAQEYINAIDDAPKSSALAQTRVEIIPVKANK